MKTGQTKPNPPSSGAPSPGSASVPPPAHTPASAVPVSGSAPQRRQAMAGAVAALSAGDLVILPAETGYLVVALATHSGAMDRLRAVLPLADRAAGLDAPVWLAPSVEALDAALGKAPAAQRRLVRRLLPGPAIFRIRPEHPAAEGVVAALGPAAAETLTAPDGSRLVRSAAPGAAALVVEKAGGPVACIELTDGGTPIREASTASDLLAGARAPAAAAVDDGPPASRKPATVIALGPPGNQGVRVLRAGAYEERFVRKQLGLTVLFVCTGNTCRSPMAVAIASGLAKAGPSEQQAVRFVSAGTGAAGGTPATPEAVAAVKALGYSLTGHTSRPLTRDLVAEADVIYAMGRSHLASVLAIDPSAAGKAQVLDATGEDVPDPVGREQAVYTETSKRLKDLISRRLEELRS